MMRTIGRGVMAIFAAGLLLALLTAFNMDIFGVGAWLINIVWTTIQGVSDIFTGNATFQKVVQTPA